MFDESIDFHNNFIDDLDQKYVRLSHYIPEHRISDNKLLERFEEFELKFDVDN